MQIEEKRIEDIVREVLRGLQGLSSPLAPASNGSAAVTNGAAPAPSAAAAAAPTQAAASQGVDGVFSDINQAIEASFVAYQEFHKLSRERRGALIQAIRDAGAEHARRLAQLAVEETRMGRLEHKVLKNRFNALRTPGMELLKTETLTGDDGLLLIEMAPYGVLGSITPVTNPTSTVINNSITMLSAGNTVVFCPHPQAQHCATETLRTLHRAIVAAGGPPNLITTAAEATMASVQTMMTHPRIKVIVATGGGGVVKAALSAGKKAIAAGPGNPPVIVDETADIERAAQCIVEGASFDNNMPCIAEKICIPVASVADDLIRAMTKKGAYLLRGRELEAVMQVATKGNEMNRAYIGQDALKILRDAGINAPADTVLAIFEADRNHIMVQHEQLMPVLPIVRVRTFDEAVELAIQVEHGFRHTALIHSKDVDRITRFAQMIETTLFVANSFSNAAVGVDGEGYMTMTVAGPTGEGLSTPRTFTRQRRLALSHSLNYVK